MLDNLPSLEEWMREAAPVLSESVEPDALLKAGAQKTLDLFHEMSVHVPAYQDFLRRQHFDPRFVTNIRQLRSIPAITKDNYIAHYSLADRCWGGRLGQAHIISSSSGTSGQLHFWPRTLRAELDGALVYERLYRDVFGIDRRRTLLLDAFALGNGIAGTFTLAGANLLSWKGYQITTMTPGYCVDDLVPLLKSMAPAFDQTIIAGMSPFLKEAVERACTQGVDFGKMRVCLTGAGQSFSEGWRRYMLDLLHATDRYHTVINIYGSADAALMGFETPLSISLRTELARQPGLSKEVFRDERLPSLFNYDPLLTFFDVEDGELHITKNAGVPLVRYNIHDTGGVLSYRSLTACSALAAAASRFPIWRLPFVYLFGRDRFMVKFYGANIYSENVQLALDRPELQPALTGRFRLEVMMDEAHAQQLFCRVELNSRIRTSDELVRRIQNIFVCYVTAANSEYNALTKIIGGRAWPIVHLIENGDPTYFPPGRKTS